MRVISSLADIDFGVGAIRRAGRNLVIESSADSTIPTTVTMTPRDAGKSIARLILSPSTWLFVLMLPFTLWSGNSNSSSSSSAEWEKRRKDTGLNKPW